MNIPLLKPTVLLTAALLCAPPVFAQVKTEPPRPIPAKPTAPAAPNPPAPPAAPVLPEKSATGGFSSIAPVAVPASSAPRKLAILKVPLSELDAAVDFLQAMLEENGLEQLNILFGPETKSLEVSALTLRNVTGPDALQLIAAAAGCTVEPMMSLQDQRLPNFNGGNWPVIGYQLRGKAKPATATKSAAPSPSGPFGGTSTSASPNMLTAPGTTPFRPLSATSPVSRITRIYPLGIVTTSTKFPDIEKTIRDTLKADNVAENQISLALHEKTNVLVVNAAEAVHALVEQLLTALNTNASQAERQSTARDRAMGREELESALRAQSRLREELSERDAMMRELQKELRKLQDSGSKPPSAK